MKKTAAYLAVAFFCSCNAPGDQFQQARSGLQSVSALDRLQLLIAETYIGTRDWLDIQGESESKAGLKKMIEKDYPQLKAELDQLAQRWSAGDREALKVTWGSVSGIFSIEKEIMQTLSSFADYEDPARVFSIRSQFDRDGELRTSFRQFMDEAGRLSFSMKEEALRTLEEGR
jgi:hypothetical protein